MSCLTLSQTDLPRRVLGPASQKQRAILCEGPWGRKPRQVCKRLRASAAGCVAYGASLIPEARSVRSFPAWGDRFLLVEGHSPVGGVLETLCPSLCSAHSCSSLCHTAAPCSSSVSPQY